MANLATLQHENKKSKANISLRILLLINQEVGCSSPILIGYAKTYENQTAKHGKI